MPFDYRKLRGRIVEKYGSQGIFAHEMNLSERTISQKLNNKTFFSQQEIARAATLLSIQDKDIPMYFFSEQSSKN